MNFELEVTLFKHSTHIIDLSTDVSFGPLRPYNLASSSVAFSIWSDQNAIHTHKMQKFGSSKILHPYSLTDAERLSQINTTQYTLLGPKAFH